MGSNQVSFAPTNLASFYQENGFHRLNVNLGIECETNNIEIIVDNSPLDALPKRLSTPVSTLANLWVSLKKKTNHFRTIFIICIRLAT